MSDRPVITTLPAGGRYDVSTLNSNFTAIRNQFDELVGRNGTSGSNNSASGNLDMNGNSLLNVGDVLDTSGAGFISSVSYAEEWANKAEDSLVSAAAGGDMSDDYSSKHFSIKSAASATASASSASTASGHVTTASNWAIKTDAAVSGSDYSAKEYAQGTQSSTGGSAKSWAQDTDQVNGASTNDRSAKNWAQGSSMTGSTLGGSAKDWAQVTGGTVDGSNDSAKEWAQGTTATSSKTYATKVDGAVTGSDFSSKAWAIGGTDVTNTSSRGAAKEWAIKAEDSTVDGSGYSALHWAAKASAHATTAAGHAQGWAAVTTLTNGTHNLEVGDAKDYYIIDASSGTVTINLPAIGDSDGLLYGFEVSNVDNAISIVRDGSDRINGAASNYSGLTTVGQVIHFISDNATPDNWLATIISQTGDASATVKGIVELATDAEAIAGSDSTRAITPANLAATFPTIRLIPQNSKSADYTLVLTDAGKHIYHPGSDTSTRTWTIPANSSVAYTIGTAITFVNDTSGGAITIAITSDTLVLAPDGTTGSRTLAANGMATAIKMTSTRWMISGSGLT